MILVLILTVFVDLIQAVAAGLIMASVLFMKQMSDLGERRVKIASLQEYKKELPWDDENIPSAIVDKIYVKHLEGPLFFGFAPAFLEMAKTLPDIRVVIFRMKRVPHIDQTGLYALEEVVMDLEKRGIATVMTGLKKQHIRMLRRINIIPGLIPEKYLFKTFDDCIEWLDQELTDTDLSDMHRFFDDLEKGESKRLTPRYRL
jgi:SulP family sulfate permease